MADISTTLELNDSKFQATLQNAVKSVSQFGSKFQNELGRINSSLNTLQGVLGVAALAKFTTDITKSALEVKRLSDYTQMGTVAILNLKKQFLEVSGDASKAGDAIADFSKNIGEASTNGGDVLKAFNMLGISLSDLGNLSQEQLWNKTIEGLKGVQDSSTRTAMQVKLFGESTKGVDLTQFTSNVGDYSAALLNAAESNKRAAEAQLAFSKFMSVLKNTFLDIITLLLEFAGWLAKHETLMRALVSTVVSLSAALAGLYIFEKIATMMAMATVATTGLGVAFRALLGPIGLAIVAFEVIDAILNKITGNTIFGWLGELSDAILGTTFATKKYTDAMAEEKNEAKKLQESRQRSTELLQKEQKALQQNLEAYQRSNQEQIDKIKLDTQLIGKGEELRVKEQALFDQRKKNADEVANLNRKISETSDPTLQAEYRKQIDLINGSYSEQKTQLEAALGAQIAKNRANQLSIFSTNSLVEANKKLAELQHETATALLPELDKKYRDIEASALASARAAIEAENIRRSSRMGSAEEAKYMEAAKVQIAELQAAEYELAKAQAKRRVRDFTISEEITQQKELRDIENERAKLTLNELEKKQYDIATAAKERARAEIEAENARTGTKMDAESEQKYYNAAEASVKTLQSETAKLDSQSRLWSTGWKQAMNDYVRNATDGAAAAHSVFQVATRGMEDMIINFAKTGKFEWKGFVNSILEELVRIEIRKTMAGLFSGPSGSGSTGGGFFSGLGNLFSGFFADGGQIPAGKFGIAGEAGPEIITGPANVTPARDLSSTQPIQQSTTVNYNISAVDAKSFQQLVASDPEFIYAVTLKGQRGMPGGR